MEQMFDNKSYFLEKVKVLWVLFLIIPKILFAQNDNKSDSLLVSLKNAKDNQEKIIILNELAKINIQAKNIEEGVSYAQKALNISTQLINRKESATSLLLLAKAYQDAKQYPTSFKNYIQAIQELEKLNLPNYLSSTYEKTGYLLTEWQVYEKALKYFLKAKSIRIDSTQNIDNNQVLLENIANSYFLIRDFDNAIKIYHQLLEFCEKDIRISNCIEYHKKLFELYNLQENYDLAFERSKSIYELSENLGDKKQIANALNNLGIAHQNLGNLDKSISFIKKSLDYCEENDLLKQINISQIQANLGILYFNKGNYNSSIEIINSSIEIEKNNEDQHYFAFLNNLLTKAYIGIQNFSEAKIINKIAIEEAEKNNYLEALENAYEMQNIIYQQLGDSKRALTAYEVYTSIKAKLYANNVQQNKEALQRESLVEKIEQEQKLLLADKERKEIELSKIQLEADKKEKELILLKREKELEKSNLEKERLDKEKAEQDLIIARRKIEADKRENKLIELQQKQEINNLEEARKLKEIELLTKDKELLKKNNELLEKNDKLHAQQLLEEKSRKQYYYLGLLMSVIILTLILVLFYNKQRDNKKLTQRNEEYANLLMDLKEKNDQLSTSEEELKQNAEQMVIVNNHLNQTLLDLKNTQSQLIQSEKMASLGQLVAGVAHEVNTPLGTIKAAIGGINKTLEHSLILLPEIFKKLNKDEEKLFFDLMDKGINSERPLTSREERKYKKILKGELEKIVPDKTNEFASLLIEMGIKDEVPKFTLLFSHPDSKSIIKLLYYLVMQKKNGTNIDLAVQKASKVMFALKTYSRYDYTDQIIKTSLKENIETVLTLYHNQLKHGIDVVKHFEDVPDIECYPDELNQIWTNLILNAVQAMNNKGQLDIYIRKLNQEVEVSIQDNGPGIPNELKDQIFAPFFTTKKSGEGSGLGLDIVSKIVKKHKGTIKVASEVDKGSTFIVKIPINQNNLKEENQLSS